MSSNKAALKAIAASIQAGKFDDAVEKAQQLLNSDSQNYQAYVHNFSELTYIH
jgi:hypothetical protein